MKRLERSSYCSPVRIRSMTALEFAASLTSELRLLPCRGYRPITEINHAFSRRRLLCISGRSFFVMMRFGCGAHVMGRGHHHPASNSNHNSATGPPSLPPGEAVDPVCGKNGQTSTAKTVACHGVIYYFCSQKCRETFEAAPASYAKPVIAGSREKDHHHGCC